MDAHYYASGCRYSAEYRPVAKCSNCRSISPSSPLAPNRNISARIHDSPSSSLIIASQSSRLLRRPDTACRLEAHRHTGFLRVVTNRARHHQADRQGRVRRLFPGRSLDEVRARHHRHHTRPRHVPQRQQVAGPEDHLHVSRSARLLERRNLIVERLPASAKNMRSSDDHIDLVRARLYRPPNLRYPLSQRRQSSRKSRGHRRHMNPAALQRRIAVSTNVW